MAPMSKRGLTPEEQKAWDRVRKSVRPMKAGNSPKVKRDLTDHPFLRQVKPAGRKAGPSTVPPGVRSSVPSRCTVTGPQNRGTEKKIRRGKVEVSASFDLHGHTQSSAWSALPAFLLREQARGSRCVIVITGKGKYGEGVLRQNFLRWLDMPEARSLVSGYAQAHPRHGGRGAFYVFIRRR